MNIHNLIKKNLTNPLGVIVILCMLSLSCHTPQKPPDTLELDIPYKSMKKLSRYVKKALEQGVITNDLKKYVKANIRLEGRTIPVKLRLKGDWTDHLNTDQWSFRIKIQDESNFHGLKIFSIMNPETRGHMQEWFVHKLLEGEGVLTTRYDFISVIINGEKKGVYAIEEHFTQELLESQGRQPGPILKISEDAYWEVTSREKRDSLKYGHLLPMYDACIITPFQKNIVLRSNDLRQQFLEAQELLYKHKLVSQPVDCLLVLDKYAKFYALSDLCKIRHGLETHNQRWYYNSNEARLEPVAYDMCVSELFGDEKRPALFGFQEQHIVEIDDVRKQIPFSPFNSMALNEKYYEYITRFSKRTYLDSVLLNLKDDIKKREILLQQDDSSYTFNTDYYYHSSERMIAEHERFSEVKYRTPPLYTYQSFTLKDTVLDQPPFVYVSLNAYYNNVDSTLALENFYHSPIQIVGYIDTDKHTQVCDTIELAKYNDNHSITWAKGINKPAQLIFRVESWDNLYYSEVIPWKHPASKDLDISK